MRRQPPFVDFLSYLLRSDLTNRVQHLNILNTATNSAANLIFSDMPCISNARGWLSMRYKDMLDRIFLVDHNDT